MKFTVFIKKCVIFCFLSVLFGCVSSKSQWEFNAYSEKIGEESSLLKFQSNTADNLNGFLPNRIYIKTSTQTFCRDYEFSLIDGYIYYKGRSNAIEPKNWELLTGTGLPHSKSKNFNVPSRIVEISSDIDSIIALSDTGHIYSMFFDDLLRADPWKWLSDWGFPVASPLTFSGIAEKRLAWSTGTRRSDIMWYTDIFGNEHHYGTMGLETLYLLSEDGREIRFTDTGLPPDFSRSFLLPERGQFTAITLRASGSTIFVMNAAGEMYTRLIDFDTMGCDPMFFKYTYKNETQPYKGTDYESNFTPWGLPAEDWKKQPSIPLTEKAAISKYITIIQNGQGNDARELRVVGLNTKGEAGYYYKQLTESQWHFLAVPLHIPNNSFLDPQVDPNSLRGPKQELAYQGIYEEDSHSYTLSVKDFPMSEGYCNLQISSGEESAEILIHPVEIWTYFKRNNPGFDGMPKRFFVTFAPTEEQKNKIESLSQPFKTFIHDHFLSHDLELFSSRLEATNLKWQLRIPERNKDSLVLSLFSNTSEEIYKTDKSSRIIFYAYDSPLIEQYFSTDLILPQSNYSIYQRSQVEKYIADNQEYKTLLENELKMYKSYSKDASFSHGGYSIVDFFTTITFLNRIDKPKIKTLTTFGSDIMESNSELYKGLAGYREWTYNHLITLLSMRIEAYKSIITKFEENEYQASVPTWLEQTYEDYFTNLGFPLKIQGEDGSQCFYLEELPLFPGYVLQMPDSNDIVLIELEYPESLMNPDLYTLDTVEFPILIHYQDKSITKKGLLRKTDTEISIFQTKLFSKGILFQASL